MSWPTGTRNPLDVFVRSIEKDASVHALSELVHSSRKLLAQNVATLDRLFDTFKCETHGCLHIGILEVKYASHYLKDLDVLFQQTESVFKTCPRDHLQKLSVLVRSISHEYTNKLISKGLSTRAIVPLTELIKKIQRSPEQLTSIHCDLCQAALAAKLFNPVLQILETDILEIDPSWSYLDARDYLLYFYYGGMIYGAMKKWDRSLHFFELCLLSPSLPISCILVEAWKKIILVSLIHIGKVTSFEVNKAHPMAPKLWELHCQPYMELKRAFAKDTPDALNSTIVKYKDTYISDHNYGLVKQVQKSYVRFRIHSLTKAFLTMSLKDVADRVCYGNTEEAEGYLIDMIQSKAIFARIDQRDGTVYFLDDPEQYNSASMFSTLQTKIEECCALEKHLISMSDQFVTNPNYIRKTIEREAKTAKMDLH